MNRVTSLEVNGSSRAVDAEPQRTLLSVLRDDLELTGCKYGCGEGRCGACTVLIDGKPARACVTRVSAVVGKLISTIEGLAAGDKLHPLQQAFLDHGALQCGYCTPGMIMSAAGLLNSQPRPTREDIERHMIGNVCRCGTYARIVAAIEQAANDVNGAAR